MYSTDLYYEAIKHPNCEVEFMSDPDPTVNTQQKRCNPIDKSYISSCNVTGNWKHYDAKVSFL